MFDGEVTAANVFKDQHLYDAMVDSVSMRGFVATEGTTGHDQFFATFERLHGIDKSHAGEQLDEVATRAAAQNEQYIEVMNTPSFGRAAALGYQLGWSGAAEPVTTAASSSPDRIGGTSRAELFRIAR